jgi:hypothetical protein
MHDLLPVERLQSLLATNGISMYLFIKLKNNIYPVGYTVLYRKKRYKILIIFNIIYYVASIIVVDNLFFLKRAFSLGIRVKGQGQV